MPYSTRICQNQMPSVYQIIKTVKSLEPKGNLPINTLEIQPRQGNKTTDKSYAFKRLLTAACILKKTYHNTKNGISPYVCMMIKKRRGRFSAGTGFQLFWSLTVSKYEHVFTSWYVLCSTKFWLRPLSPYGQNRQVLSKKYQAFL